MEKKNIMIGSFCAVGCEVLYGLSYIFTKQATDHASVFALLGWRFLLALVVMSVLVAVGALKINLKGKSLKSLFVVALFSPVMYFIGETFGIRHTTASESGVFLACIPVASLIASAAILRKKPTRLQVVGILITLAGVLITVFVVGTSSSLSIAGYAFLMVAVVSYALYCVFVEKASDYSEAEITYMMLAVGAVVFITLAVMEALLNGDLYSLAILPFKSKAFLIAMLYQGIGCSICAFFLSNIAIARIGVNRTSSFIGIATVVSIIAGALLLKEVFSFYQVIGAVIIVIGVYTANAKIQSKNK